MRKLHDLDEEIARAERRLEVRRDELSERLDRLRNGTRRRLASPAVLMGALAAGFLIDRLGRLKTRRAEGATKAGAAGVFAGLAAAALRAAIANPRVWESLRGAWRGRRTQVQSVPPASA